MRLNVAMLPELAGDVSNSVCIVIDVLRATSVAATLFHRGCPRIYAAPGHEAARSYARAHSYVLCGETGGVKEPDFDYGNSPVEFAEMDFTGRPVVLSTSNGTRAINKVAGARMVLLGAALNRMAVSRSAWNHAVTANANITLVCSGTNGDFTLEDANIAGLYVEAIVGLAGMWDMPDVTDSAVTCRRLWEHEPYLLRGLMEGAHARTLSDHGFGADIGFCCSVDIMSVVPTLVAEPQAASVEAPVLLVK